MSLKYDSIVDRHETDIVCPIPNKNWNYIYRQKMDANSTCTYQK